MGFLKKPLKERIINIFVDMDGVLAVYDKDTHLHMSEPGYFLTKEMYPNSKYFMSVLRELEEENKSITVYILSKLPHIESTSYRDKLSWLGVNFPHLRKQNIYLLQSKWKKGDFIKEHFIQDGQTSCTNILFDDFTENLVNWESKGDNYIGVKVLNGCNNTSKRWAGRTYNLLDIESEKEILTKLTGEIE